MNDSLWLTPDEVEELTAKKRWPAQCRALAVLGVAFRPNAVGRPLVERAAVTSARAPARKQAEPNWGAIKHGKAAQA
ncbi:DUF4224 domain-containing protein [Dokdonella sp. MW10]|uniref:DUF4224 domain-containing protein n=1 Tax=Dokdonella sp. MW10 TaxID=2992926 RepID=UPI003F7DAF63